MAKLVASTFVGNGSLWLYLDHKLIMQNSDTAALDLEDDKEYILHWYVNGPAGNPYSITISSPKEAQFQLTKILKASGKDHGVLNFGS